jgi:hypothetical protein
MARISDLADCSDKMPAFGRDITIQHNFRQARDKRDYSL